MWLPTSREMSPDVKPPGQELHVGRMIDGMRQSLLLPHQAIYVLRESQSGFPHRAFSQETDGLKG